MLAAEVVSWKSLGHAVQIIGKLGVPPGQAVEIEATIVAGRTVAPSTGGLALVGAFLLKVTKVSGNALSLPGFTFFEPFGSEVELPHHFTALCAQKKIQHGSSWTNEEIATVEKGYVGTHVPTVGF